MPRLTSYTRNSAVQVTDLLSALSLSLSNTLTYSSSVSACTRASIRRSFVGARNLAALPRSVLYCLCANRGAGLRYFVDCEGVAPPSPVLFRAMYQPAIGEVGRGNEMTIAGLTTQVVRAAKPGDGPMACLTLDFYERLSFFSVLPASAYAGFIL